LSNVPSFKRYLVEETKEVFFTFGRMNPPTVGHGKLMNVMSTKAGSNAYKIYLSQSNDARKNPLTYEQKIKHSRKMFPKHARNIIKDKKLRNVFEVASSLYDQGFNRVTMVVGADRITEFKTLLEKYNGVKGRHGFYNFEKINIVSAGDRDPDSEGVEGMSASKQRENASKNDFTTFSQGVPRTMSNPDTKKLFNDVRRGMGLKETKEFKNKVSLESVGEVRERYIEGDLFNEGDRVRTKAGRTGSIHRLGSNYVIVALDEGRISRHWLEDVELIEGALTAERDHKPAPEWGTPASTKKAKKMTPNEAKAADEVDNARKIIDREQERDKEKFTSMMKRARLARARRKNREDDVAEGSCGDKMNGVKFNPKDLATFRKRNTEGAKNPVAKNMNKFNKPATHKDKKKDAKRGYQKHKGQLNGGN